ncbi:ribonuclease P protein component 3 [Methanothermobacter sp.]|uniref:ribonuclease P protein component 3 n=1 Tax=Methanothermobacter sp. TaxID=1884223 RepID=UPI003C72DC3F
MGGSSLMKFADFHEDAQITGSSRQMKFFDFHLQAGDHDSSLRLLAEASRLGYHGAVLVFPDETYSRIQPEIEVLRDDPEIMGLEVASGVMIEASNPRDMRRKVNRFRRKVDLVYVSGGNLKVNRAACENPRVDVLSAPYSSRRDAGMNHVLAREAARNRVAVELVTTDIMGSWLKVRARVLEYFRDILKLHRKFDFPLLLSSRASSIYDLRTPRDLMNLAGCFGMSTREAGRALSSTPSSIIEYSRKRPFMIADGVMLVDDEEQD